MACDDVTDDKQRWSISSRLLLTVNSICIVLLMLFIVHDHHRETIRRLDDKRIALEEESAIILVAVRNLKSHGVENLQPFVDRTCVQMEKTHSPGHHIVIEFPDHLIQADAHHQAGEDILQAMKTALGHSGQLGRFESNEMVVGSRSGKNVTVYISEFVDEVRAEVLQDSFRRLGGSLLLATIAAVIVNVVLLRVVVHPINRLATTVNAIGNGGYGQKVNGFHSRELSFLAGAINRMSGSLAQVQAQRQLQLAKARRIQTNLLPELDQLSGAVFCADYIPADDVAGDFYDVHQMPDDSWIIFLADVTGHGIPAAMNAALLKTYFEDGCDRFDNLSDIAQHINRRFAAITLPEDFATAVLVRYRPASHLIQVLNAGHDSVMLRRKNHDHRDFTSSGFFLGLMEEADWVVEECPVTAGDRLFLYTDGLTETFGSQQTMFGRERVAGLLNQTADQRPPDALVTIRTAADFFRSGPQLDDITTVLIDF